MVAHRWLGIVWSCMTMVGLKAFLKDTVLVLHGNNMIAYISCKMQDIKLMYLLIKRAELSICCGQACHCLVTVTSQGPCLVIVTR